MFPIGSVHDQAHSSTEFKWYNPFTWICKILELIFSSHQPQEVAPLSGRVSTGMQLSPKQVNDGLKMLDTLATQKQFKKAWALVAKLTDQIDNLDHSQKQNATGRLTRAIAKLKVKEEANTISHAKSLFDNIEKHANQFNTKETFQITLREINDLRERLLLCVNEENFKSLQDDVVDIEGMLQKKYKEIFLVEGIPSNNNLTEDTIFAIGNLRSADQMSSLPSIKELAEARERSANGESIAN